MPMKIGHYRLDPITTDIPTELGDFWCQDKDEKEDTSS